MDATTSTTGGDGRWQRLLHRWFVQYNPIYLVSAMLVLGGTITASRGLTHEGSLYGPLGIAAIAELYALALIGGAALLTRIGQRRPAVLLALLTVLYQGDLTLHTETCAFLGVVGVAASAGWLALFVVKLRALTWALRVRVSPRALATAVAGAAGLAVGPYVLSSLDARTSGELLALFVFALGALHPRHVENAVATRVPLDDWGHTVLRRTVRATWILWAALLGLHFVFWSTQREIQLAAVVPSLALLLIHRIQRESRAWIAIAALLAVVALVAPTGLAGASLLSAIALVRRATRAEDPVGTAERVRLVSGGLFAIHLALWTTSWKGGALPEHVLLLDVALAAAVLFLVWRAKARAALVPLAVLSVHGVVTAGLVPAPRTSFQYGMTAIGLGFVLLLASLATSYRLRHWSDGGDPPPS